jgi:hypothetical protein
MDWLKSIGGHLKGWPLLFLSQKRIDMVLYNAIICPYNNFFKQEEEEKE